MGTPIKSATHAPLGWLINCVLTKKVTLDSSSVDSGNTGMTHIIRAGMILGKSTGVTPSGAAIPFLQTDTTNNIGGTAHFILMHDVDLKDGDPSATATDHQCVVMLIGSVKAGVCLLEHADAIADLKKGGSGEGFIEFI